MTRKHKKAKTRLIRLAVAAGAALALTAPAVQAKPLVPFPQPQQAATSSPGYQGTYRPVTPVTSTQTVSAQASGESFDWSSAAIGAGSALALVLVAGGGVAARGRRNVPLSA